MNIPLLAHLAHLIEEILKSDVPVIEKAAADEVVTGIQQDPKIRNIHLASLALLSAAQDLKEAAQTPAAK